MDDTQGTSPGSPSGDGVEFEPTAEMMVNDFDDERTLDEEEALDDDDQQSELKDLEKEKDMPIEALLAMYGYNETADQEEDEGSTTSSSASEDILSSRDLTLDKEEVGRDVLGDGEEAEAEVEGNNGEQQQPSENIDMEEPSSRIDEEQNCSEPIDDDDDDEEEIDDDVDGSLLRDSNSRNDVKNEETPSLLTLYKDDPSVVGGSRHLRSGSRQHSEDEEDEEDECDSSPEEDDWKKTIMVGSDFQASIPDGLCKYDDAMPYENEDKLLWNPCQMPEKDVREYLSSIQTMQDVQGVQAIPRGSHIRDDEQALYLLLQCGHNLEEALRRQKINSISTPDTMSLWSEEECRNFETGLRTFGKDFHAIQQSRVRTRSVSELVQFYYLWKKTERHDVFANKARLEKKKYTLHPGTTDFMERFLDEQDNSPVTSPNNIHSLISGDPKRQNRNPPIHHHHHHHHHQQQSTEMDITVDESSILNSHLEDIANHLTKEGLESLYKLASGSKHPNGISSSSGGPKSSSVATSTTISSTLSSHDGDTVSISLSRAPQFIQASSPSSSESLLVNINHSTSPTTNSYAQ